MPYIHTIWDLDDDPDGNVAHIAQHDVTKQEVEEVLNAPYGVELSRSSALPIAFGESSTGRLLAVVYQEVDGETAYPVTAYEIEP